MAIAAYPSRAVDLEVIVHRNVPNGIFQKIPKKSIILLVHPKDLLTMNVDSPSIYTLRDTGSIDIAVGTRSSSGWSMQVQWWTVRTAATSEALIDQEQKHRQIRCGCSGLRKQLRLVNGAADQGRWWFSSQAKRQQRQEQQGGTTDRQGSVVAARCIDDSEVTAKNGLGRGACDSAT